jgi:FkbM family methyltransferase
MSLKKAAFWAIRSGINVPSESLTRIEELVHLRSLLTQLDVDCVLDVGANRGQFASEVRGIGYSGPIISFEPIASEFNALKSRFAADPQWQGHQIALGRDALDTVINVPNKTVNASLLTPVSGEKCRQEPMKVRRLDSIELPYSRVFLKMDTQGYDLEVFAGAQGVLGRIVGLQSELSVVPLYDGMPRYLKALETYETAGFLLFNLAVVNRVADGGLLELNCFMRRARA